ncbi:MAG TPA: malate synthase A, partial [Candidatus Limnocylindria bacterium]
ELEDGKPMSAERYTAIRDEELGRLQSTMPDFRFTDAAELLDDLVLSDDFTEFLTIPAYDGLR